MGITAHLTTPTADSSQSPENSKKAEPQEWGRKELVHHGMGGTEHFPFRRSFAG